MSQLCKSEVKLNLPKGGAEGEKKVDNHAVVISSFKVEDWYLFLQEDHYITIILIYTPALCHSVSREQHLRINSLRMWCYSGQ